MDFFVSSNDVNAHSPVHADRSNSSDTSMSSMMRRSAPNFWKFLCTTNNVTVPGGTFSITKLPCSSVNANNPADGIVIVAFSIGRLVLSNVFPVTRGMIRMIPA